MIENGLVFITDRGRSAQMLMTVEEFQRITGSRVMLIDALGQLDFEDVNFEPPRLGDLPHTVDLG